MNDEDIPLTDTERKAIRVLKSALVGWPKSLVIFAGGFNGLSIRKPDKQGSYGAQREVAAISGVPADGGDGGDVF